MIQRTTPEAFRMLVSSATVPMLPLVDDHSRQWAPGWTTYTDHFENNPDIEVFCGGENEKYATAAAVWRQGNLLHFGFEQSPAELNENGRRLLLNCIAYISRFTEDRPIAVTPSVFAGPAALPRTYIDRRIIGKNDPKELEWMLTPELFRKISGMTQDQMRSWHKKNLSYLHPSDTAEKRLEILPDLPTMAEAGYPVEASYWFGLVAPAGTPPAALSRLEKALADVLAMPDVRKRLGEMGAIVSPLSGRQFGDYIRTEITKWAAIVDKAGVKPE